MRREYRLRKRDDFSRVYKAGRSVAGKYVVVYQLRADHQGVRVGVSAGKKLGNAVTRNRIKRIVREAARELLPTLEQGLDFIIIGRAGAKRVKMQEVKADLARVIKRFRRSNHA